MKKFLLTILFSIYSACAFAGGGISVDKFNADGVANSVNGSITVLSPTNFKTFQRSGTTGNISINGTYTGTPTSIEASFNGGSYATITASPSGGTFNGTLTSQAQGQGTLTVRFTNNTSVSNSKSYVGIGEVFLVAGQSNGSGRGSSNQTYSSTDGFKAVLFGNDYVWKELVDPYDSPTGQIDTVSSDSTAGGSWVVLLATEIMNQTHVPVAFIPSCLSGTGLTDWAVPTNHQDRTTLYGSAVYRSLQTNGIRAVLWWQGEHEANAGNTQAYYYDNFSPIAVAFKADLNAKTMPIKLQNSAGIPDGQETPILAAIGQAWLDTATVLPGPDVSDITSDDTFHLITTPHLQTAADRWFAALQTAFGW